MIYLNNYIRWMQVLCCSFTLTMLMGTDGLAQEAALFESISMSSTTFSAEQTALLSSLEQAATTKEVSVVNIDEEVLLSAARIVLPLPSGKTYTLIKDKVHWKGVSEFTWMGWIEGEEGVVHIRVKDNIIRTGNIHISKDQSYAIKTLGGRLYAIIEQMPRDNTKTPRCGTHEIHQKESHEPPLVTLNNAFNKSNKITSNNCMVRLVIAYTQAALDYADRRGDNLLQLIQQEVDDVNISFQNSNVPQRVEIAYAYQTDYDGWSMQRDLDRIIDPNDGYIDEIHSLRNIHRADIGVLYTNDFGPGHIDIGSLGITNWPPLRQERAFIIMNSYWTSPSLQHYSLAHEIAHNYGAMHTPEQEGECRPHPADPRRRTGHCPNNPDVEPFPRAHGYLFSSYATIMAPYGPDTRIPYFSDPSNTYNGVPYGTDETHHVTRVLRDNADIIVNYNPAFPDNPILSNTTVNSGEIYNYSGTSTVTANNNFTIRNGSLVQFRAGNKVLLKPGFKAVAGSHFHAYIDNDFTNCGSNKLSSISDVEDRPVTITAYPNPFEGSIQIAYTIEEPTEVSLRIYDMYGREVIRLVDNQYHDSGDYQLTFDAKDIPSGVYFYTLKAGTLVETKKIVKVE